MILEHIATYITTLRVTMYQYWFITQEINTFYFSIPSTFQNEALISNVAMGCLKQIIESESRLLWLLSIRWNKKPTLYFISHTILP